MKAEESGASNHSDAVSNVCLSDSPASENIDRHFEEQQLPTKIIVLFPEMLVKIFSYLDKKDLSSVARVCKSWHESAYSKCLWQNIEVKIDLEEPNSVLFASLAQRGIKKLQIWSIEKHLPDLIMVFPNLESLYVSGVKTISKITQGSFLRIQSFNEVPDNSVHQIALHCKNLNKLCLDNSNSITDRSLMLIAWGLKSLKILSLRLCNPITDLGIKYIVGHSLNPSADGNRLLECLELEGCTNISDVALQYLSDGFMEHLKTLNLNHCSRITNVGLKHLSRIGSLREVKVNGCPQITNVGVEYLVQGGCKVDASVTLNLDNRTIAMPGPDGRYFIVSQQEMMNQLLN